MNGLLKRHLRPLSLSDSRVDPRSIPVRGRVSLRINGCLRGPLVPSHDTRWNVQLSNPENMLVGECLSCFTLWRLKINTSFT